MEFQFKISVWEEIIVPENKEQEILQAIKDGKITCSNDVYGYCVSHDIQFEVLSDTEEQITPNNNNGESTIYVMDNEDETIYENGK